MPIYPSHVPDYDIYQKFCTSEQDRYSTRLCRAGTGTAILIKKGINYNELEWASWQDQILTAIVYEKHYRKENQNITHGTIFMSVYRRQGQNSNIIFEKIQEIMASIRQRY